MKYLIGLLLGVTILVASCSKQEAPVNDVSIEKLSAEDQTFVTELEVALSILKEGDILEVTHARDGYTYKITDKAFSIQANCQITDKELQSSEFLSFFNEMIQDEKIVFGQIKKSKSNKWSISADTDKKVDSFMFSKIIFELQESNLRFGLSKTIEFLLRKKNMCYEYIITRDEYNGWNFYIYKCE